MKKITKKIGQFSVPEGLLETIHKYSSWDDERSKYYGLESSRSILLKYNLQYPEGMVPHISPEVQELLKKVEPIIEYVKSFYPSSYCCKAIITNLPPGSRVESHVDPGWAFSLQKRFHWAISTNEEVLLSVGTQNIHIPIGEIWEINNKEIHGAINSGKTERLHLIFDLIIIEDAIAKTPEPFEPDSFDDRLFKIILHKKRKTGKFVVQSLNEKL